MDRFKKLSLLTALTAVALAGCGGGSSTASGQASQSSAISGTAAVGYAIVGAAVNVKCASAAPVPSSSTSSAGALQIDLTGSTFPCALEVTGGTINSVANTVAYHSIAMVAGNVNVTPLTDLLVANLAGSTTPSAWYAALTPASLAAITSAQVSTASSNVKAALGLTTQLAGIELITTAFTPTRDNVMDKTLEALQSAMTANSNNQTALLGLAGSATGAPFTSPAGFNTALSTAYLGTVPTPTPTPTPVATLPTVSGFSPVTGNVGTNLTITGTNLNAVNEVLFTGPSPSTAFVAGVIATKTATSIATTVPAALAAGTYIVSVVYTGGEVAASGTFNATVVSGGGTPVVIAASLPDTGITANQCYDASTSGTFVSCTSATALSLSATQDGMLGRDVDTPLASDGKLGFSYSQVGNYPITDCVKDNVTGLTWEGKPLTGSRAADKTFTNYDDTTIKQVYTVAGAIVPTQAQVDASTNSIGFKNAVNAAALCGFTDWRMPTAKELQTLVDYGVAYPGPTIDSTWLLNGGTGAGNPPGSANSGSYWTSTTFAVEGTSRAMYVDFGSGYLLSNARSIATYSVRLVR